MPRNLSNNFLTLPIFVMAVLGFVVSAHDAEAAHTDPLFGYAWSANIGWISFNCADLGVCATSNYSVGVRSTDKKVIGYAWSENIGWIKFDPSPDFATGVYPEDPQYSTLYSSTNQRLTGWARACAGTVNGDCASTTSPGWDGWIKMIDSGAVGNRPRYNPSTDEFEGWMWGSDVIGWISLNCNNDHDETQGGVQSVCGTSNYKVTAIINQHPVTWKLEQTPFYKDSENFCQAPPKHIFSWKFQDDEDCPDPDGGDCPIDQTGYDLQIDNNDDFLSLEVNLSCMGGCAKTRSVNIAFPPGANQLAYNTTYFWRVRVYDSSGAISNWSYPPSPSQNGQTPAPGNSFATEPHLYPDADFTYVPKKPSVGEEITFTENAKCYDINNNLTACPLGAANYRWDFVYVSPTFDIEATGQAVKHTYNDAANKIIAFEVTDQDGKICRITKNLKPKPPLPRFRETAPTSMLEAVKNAFVSLVHIVKLIS